MSNKHDKEKRRITIDVTQAFFERLERLERQVDAQSKAEVIREALQLYEYVADRQLSGWRFQTKHRESGDVENLVFLDLPNQMTAP